MSNAVLLVDDDANVLAAHRRTLRQFEIKTAASGSEALSLMSAQRFAVVVADMHMSGMNGVHLLGKVREAFPDTVRVMLTGDGAIKTAVDAVNQGHIFRFLTKPCPTPALVKTITAALEQYRLVTAERELLEQTLSGTVRVLTEVLSLVNPAAFSTALRIRKHVQCMTERLRLTDAWKYEVAAMLSQLGCITLPADILEAVKAGHTLPEGDEQRFALHASVAHDLLANIPRLEGIARMIAGQHKPSRVRWSAQPHAEMDAVDVGAALLHVAVAFERLMSTGLTAIEAAEGLRARGNDFDPVLVAILEATSLGTDLPTNTVPVNELQLGMVLAESICTHNGMRLVNSGTEVTRAVLVRLANFSRVGAIGDTVAVFLMPAKPPSSEVAPVAL